MREFCRAEEDSVTEERCEQQTKDERVVLVLSGGSKPPRMRNHGEKCFHLGVS